MWYSFILRQENIRFFSYAYLTIFCPIYFLFLIYCQRSIDTLIYFLTFYSVHWHYLSSIYLYLSIYLSIAYLISISIYLRIIYPSTYQISIHYLSIYAYIFMPVLYSFDCLILTVWLLWSLIREFNVLLKDLQKNFGASERTQQLKHYCARQTTSVLSLEFTMEPKVSCED